jgi:hypothetical protein
MVFRGMHLGLYSSWRIYEAQFNGFSHNSYREEVQEEFNLFLADDAMAFQGMDVEAHLKVWLFKLCMLEVCMWKLWLLKQWLIRVYNRMFR